MANRLPGPVCDGVVDGNDVEPVTVDEFRIAVAETYDVIVELPEARPYAIVAESMARTTMARGTLAPQSGMAGEMPALRVPPLLTMADMGMAHGGMDHVAMGHDTMADDEPAMTEMDHAAMGHDPAGQPDPFYAPGSGLVPAAADGGRFLSYADLRAAAPLYPDREPTREIELRLTGNMERYIWSINDVKYEDSEPIRLRYGERVRFKFANETMMTHPMHLHGMWSILDTGQGQYDPLKHVISVSPGTTVYMETEVDAPGEWVFHCHLAYHMTAGMMRKVIVEGGPENQSAAVLPAPGE